MCDLFDVSVGPVVSYRDPHKGRWFPFIVSRGLPEWQTATDLPRKRRFLGQTFDPPFVVVRRTSRPGDRHRAVGTIIAGDRAVAVENHLIVARPRDSKLKTCEALLSVLHTPKTSSWLNQRICCRHLTVVAVRDLPWWRPEG